MRRLTILIIDDDQEDIDLFRDAILDMDSTIRIDSATSAEDALEFLNKSSNWPNYIFLDLNMPRMNGKECIIALKNDPRFKSIPIVIYTTSKLKDDAEQTRLLGAEYFITKPSSLVEFKKAVNTIINKTPHQEKSNSSN